MKLSICLMVKDEEKNLERCLNSMKLLLDNADSELIIVDTGSKDRTVEIAKSYTHKVYFHPWNHNFSEMRNITLSYAQGKWIFMIDADEEVVDATPLVKFLEIDDKDKVGACAVSLRNILNENDASQQSEFIFPRIFRRTKDLKYKGAIHNEPVFTGELVLLNLTLNHYGYMSTDKELMEKKFQRTKTLLEQELIKDPQNIYYRHQLSVSFAMHNDKEDALIHAVKAYELVKEKGLNPKDYIYIYAHLVNCYVGFANLAKAEQLCVEGLELEREHLDLHFYLAKIKYMKNDIDAAIIHYQEYLNLMDNYEKLNVRRNPKILFNLINKYTEVSLELAGIYFDLKRYGQAKTLLVKLNLNKLPDKRHIEYFAKVFMNAGEFRCLKSFYINQDDTDDKAFFQEIIEQYYKNLNLILKRTFLNVFSEDYKNDDYLKLQRMRLLFLSTDTIEVKTLLSEFAENYDFNVGKDFFGEVLYYYFKLFIPVDKMLNKITEINILIYFKYLSQNYPDFNLLLYHYTRTMESPTSISELRTYRILYKYLLATQQDDFEKTFFNYLYFGLKYIVRIYNEEIIRSELTIELRNNEDAFLVYLSLALDNYNRDQRPSFLRKALKVYPQMAKGIELLLDDKFLIWSQQKELKVQLNTLVSLQEYDSLNQVIEEYKLIVGDTLDADFHSIQGATYIYLDQPEKAKEVLLEGLEKDPANVDILFNLGYLNSLVGNFNLAIDYYIKAKGNCLNPDVKLQINQQLVEIDKMMIQDEKSYIIVISNDITEELIESVRTVDHDLSIDLALLGSINTNYGLLFRKIISFNKLELLLNYIIKDNYQSIVCYKLSHVQEYLQNYGINVYSNIGEAINCSKISTTKKLQLIDPRKMYSDITIVIPTYNRPMYLSRLIEYIKNYKTIRPNVIVLDSSEPETRLINRNLIYLEDNDKLEYYEFDSSTDFIDKTYFGLKTVKSNYVCFCADDDYLKEEGLWESLEILAADYSLFSVKGKNLYYLDSSNRLREYDFFNGAYEEDPIKRIQEICKGFVPSMWYQVFRTAQFEQLYRFIVENRKDFPDNTVFFEYLFYFMILASGKVAKGTLDFNIRNKGIESESYRANFPDTIIDQSFNANYLKLRKTLIKYLDWTNYNNSGLEAQVDSAFISFMNNFLAIPLESIKFLDNKFNLDLLLEGCKHSWVWPK